MFTIYREGIKFNKLLNKFINKMRIYNGTNSQVDIPLLGDLRLSIPAHQTSGDFMGNTDFITLLVTSFDCNELAIIVSGPFELSICANVPTAVNYVVQSLDEALQRFAVPQVKSEPVIEVPVGKECTSEEVCSEECCGKEEQPKEDEKVEETQPKVTEQEDSEKKEPVKKARRKKVSK